jgi:hypothetical protein
VRCETLTFDATKLEISTVQIRAIIVLTVKIKSTEMPSPFGGSKFGDKYNYQHSLHYGESDEAETEIQVEKEKRGRGQKTFKFFTAFLNASLI